MPGDEPDDLDRATLGFIFEYVRGAPEQMAKTIDSLDTKAFTVLSTAAVVLGLAGLSLSSDVARAVGLIIAVAILGFIWTGWWCYQALTLRDYRSSLQADELWLDLWSEPVEAIKHALVADIAAAYAYNRTHLTAKRRALQRALIGLVVEVACVGAALATAHII